MTADEALELAKQLAAEKGWPWTDPIRVNKKRRWFRFVSWIVLSNADVRGGNVCIEVDAATGQINAAAYWPR